MIRKFITELAAELGVVIPPKKVKKSSSNTSLLEKRKNFNFNETWQVCWTSRHGAFSGDTRPEIAAFISHKEAKEFAEVLRESYKLLRHTSETNVTVKKGV